MSQASAAAVIEPKMDQGPKRMKGIGFVNVKQYVLERYDADTWQQVMRSMGHKDHADVEAAIAVGWYDTYLFARLLRAVDSKCGRGDLGLLRDVGHYEAERDYNRAVRMLMRVVSPRAIFTGHARLWSHFQDAGTWTIQDRSLGIGATLSDWAVDAALCTELAGYLERLIEFNGGKNVSVGHIACRATGSSDCTFNCRWT